MKNFIIEAKGEVSAAFLKEGITDFKMACGFVSILPYRRNINKSEVTCILKDKFGTCSTKHAALRKLAIENNQYEIELVLGIFKMDAVYAPSIKNTLQRYQIDYIPEAHNYLKIDGSYYDFTYPNSSYSDFEDKLLSEQIIEFNQITEHKINLHQAFFSEWLKTANIPLSLIQIWAIREECIKDLQEK